MCVGMGRLPPANPKQVVEDVPLEVGNGNQTQVAEADPGPVMPNLNILLLTFILLLFLLFGSPLHCVKVYLVANKHAHVLP